MPIFQDNSKKRDVGDESFWKMTPPRTARAESELPPPPSKETEAVSVEDPGVSPSASHKIPSGKSVPGGVITRPSGFVRQNYTGAGRTARIGVPPRIKAELLLEYAPENSLIRRVKVYRWPNVYHFYERFIHNARISHAAVGHECPRVPFFSYIPQYRQLTRSQAHFYFWFRDNAREGRYVPADLSYILLYVYEIINLPDLIPPEKGIELLCGLYLAYREEQRELDRYMPEWLCDYCLIHRLPMPRCLTPLLSFIVSRCSLKEFYFPGDLRTGSLIDAAGILIAAVSDYQYTKSRWYAQCKADYDRHIPAAVAAALEAMRGGQTGLFDEKIFRTVTVSRDAFCGSLCEHNIKRRIDVEVDSFSRIHECRGIMTAAVKYAENQIRARHRLKSRLATTGILPEVKAAIDVYFGRELPAARRAAAEEIPSYEAYYDAPDIPFSAASARAIEERSWNMTELLTEKSPEEVFRETEFAPEEEWAEPVRGEISFDAPVGGADEPGEQALAEQAFPDHSPGGESSAVKDALRTLLSGGTLREAADKWGLFPDDLAARVNEEAYDRIGDVVLEDSGTWELIPDYRKDVEEWINT